MGEQLSRRQVQLILRRTAELERQSTDESSELISAGELERVAEELGMSTQALRQALAESRAGLLVPETERSLADRVFGSAVVDARRFVPGDLGTVRAAVERFLREQGFAVARHHADVVIWVRARTFLTTLRRVFAPGPYRLPDEAAIEVRVLEVPGGPHPVLVHLRADASRVRGKAVAGVTAATVIGAAGAVAGAALLTMPVELAAFAASGAVALGGALGGRRSYRTTRERLQTALERFLDFLERPPAGPAASHRDPVARLVDFLASDWWR
jgi:hypothetical protein